MRAALVCAAIILAVAGTPAFAAKKGAGRGVGTGTCVQFGQLYKSDPKNIDLIYTSWAQGFMSGWNFSTLPSYRDLGASTAESQMMRIRNYCDEHPLVPFVKAVLEVYLSLPELQNSN